MFSVILYTHTRPPPGVWQACWRHLNAAVDASAHADMAEPHRIMVTSRKADAVDGWDCLTACGVTGLHDCYTKIVAGLERALYSQVFLVEHDVLYPPGYFDWQVPDNRHGYWFNTHVYRQNPRGFWSDPVPLTSNCTADRDYLLALFRHRLALLGAGQRVVWDEPGRNQGDPGEMLFYVQPRPTVDIRYGGNLTGMREAKNGYTAELAPFGKHADLWTEYGV